MIKRILLALLALFAMPAIAGPWTVGPQTPTYTPSHPVGDGSDAHGGQAPAYAYEEADVPTNPTILSNWTLPCASRHIISCGEYQSQAEGGSEAKARFDCNIAFKSHDDPILAPGVANGSSHDHSFSGNTGAQAAPQNTTYASLRASGYSTCYGGPLNRTLYWEPDLKLLKNGVEVTIKPRNIVTYYQCGAITEGPLCSRWPRGWKVIGGFNMADPNNDRTWNIIHAIDPGFNGYNQTSTRQNGFRGGDGWFCSAPATPSYTAWSPNQAQGSGQPYLADAAGHPTLNCTVQSISGYGTGVRVFASISAPTCWDGINLDSPNGRDHMIYGITDMGLSGNQQVCPDHWYRVVAFIAKPEFAFASNAEMTSAYLSSDRMPGMTQFNNGQSMHFDLIPAWDYGTGDNPGVMLRFFRDCEGMTMLVKNATGGGSTTLSPTDGGAHTCGYGRFDLTTQGVVDNTAPPDGQGPNPVVNLNPDQTGTNRFFPLTVGTPIGGAQIHTH